MKHPISYDSPTNIIYICKKTNNEHDNTLYTDNINTSSKDQFKAVDNA
jgi:hypothetical protein